MIHLPVLPALAAPQSSALGGMPLLILQFGLIFVIFYFLLIRPQQKQKKQHEAQLKMLKRGDEIVTAGGVIGEIIHIPGAKEGAAATDDDRITIKSAESRLVIERARIARVITSAGAGKGAA